MPNHNSRVIVSMTTSELELRHTLSGGHESIQQRRPTCCGSKPRGAHTETSPQQHADRMDHTIEKCGANKYPVERLSGNPNKGCSLLSHTLILLRKMSQF
jgi:hypothetical protein